MQNETALDSVIRMREAAQTLGVSVSGLRNIIARGDGPRPVRVGRLLGFRRNELEAWLKSQTVAPTDELTAA